MESDAAAVEAVRNGDTERFGELVERYHRLVYGIAWSRLGEPDLCDDAVQETFVQGFRHLGGLRKPEKFAAWIARIAHNIALAIGKRRRRELSRRERWKLDELPSPEGTGVEADSVDETLRESLSSLSGTYRESLVVFYLQGSSVPEAADLLGISEGAFRVRLHRARAKLRQAMEERLERSLRGLSLQRELRRRVLSALPAFPVGWAPGAAGLGSLAGAVGAAMVFSPLFVSLWYCYRRWTGNLREQAGFRHALLKRNLVTLALVCAIVLGAFGFVRHTWGSRVLDCLLAVLLLAAIPYAVRRLRVNTSRLTIAAVVGLSAMALAAAANAFLDTTAFWLPALCIFFAGVWWARRCTPRRLDYSLFVRAANRGLANPPGAGMACRPVSLQELRHFAKFMGELFLAVDFRMQPAGITIYLPPVALHPVRGFLPLPAPLAGWSALSIGTDGNCAAWLSAHDLHALEALDRTCCVDARGLEDTVAESVVAALSLFLAGDEAGAESLLQAEPDEAVFLQPPHTRARPRAAYAMALAVIGALLLMLAVALLAFALK